MSLGPVYTPEETNSPAFCIRHATINRSTFFTCLASRQGSSVVSHSC